MVRFELGIQARGKWFSYKRTILAICSINIVIGLYVLRSIYGSLYLYSASYATHSVEYTADHLEKMEESMRIRKESEPLLLVKAVKEIQHEFAAQASGVYVSWPVKQMIRDEILEKLRSLPSDSNLSTQREKRQNGRRSRVGNAEAARKQPGNGQISARNGQDTFLLYSSLQSLFIGVRPYLLTFLSSPSSSASGLIPVGVSLMDDGSVAVVVRRHWSRFDRIDVEDDLTKHRAEDKIGLSCWAFKWVAPWR